MPLRIGNHAMVDTRCFDGVIDEIRIAAVARSNAWMAAQHASDSDSLLTFLPEEARPDR
jgi:hypothetical protein